MPGQTPLPPLAILAQWEAPAPVPEAPLMAQIPWEKAPYALRRERCEELLATPRPGPRNREPWYQRVRALQTAEAGMPDGGTRDRLTAEIAAMFRARDVLLERTSIGYRHSATADELAMLDCEMRSPDVLGLTKAQTGHQRICFVDGKPLPPRRQFWCSDECVNLWTSNHEWTAASHAALTRDEARCQRCGYQARMVCNGRHVIEGKGVVWGQEAILTGRSGSWDNRPPWPCKEHTHPAYRSASGTDVDDATGAGICYVDGNRWPCYASDRPGHRRVVRPRAMEVNHKIPRAGAGYHQGCHHHLADLETLCHPCHVVETTRQGRERRGALT